MGQETPATRFATDAPPLDELAAKIVAAYEGLDSLYIESQIYEGKRNISATETAELVFDEKAPLIATVKSWMRPAHELRTEVYVGDKLVWGMVSKAMEQGKSLAVQWNQRQITKPYPAGGLDNGRGWNLNDDVPGQCVLGWYVFSLVGGTEAKRDTLPSWLWKERISGGKFEGHLKDVAGCECYCISFAPGKSVLFKHYVDPKTFLVTQIDKVQLIQTPGGKIAGVGSQRWTFKYEKVKVDPKQFDFPAPGEREEVEARIH